MDTSMQHPPRPPLLLGYVRRLARMAEGVAFWAAVWLPLLYLPPLVAGNPLGWSPEAVLWVVAVNALAVVAGHRHRRP